MRLSFFVNDEPVTDEGIIEANEFTADIHFK